MAEKSEVRDVRKDLEDAVGALALKAAGTTSSSHAEAYASAARQLAEAHAWLTAPSQSH
ncbi:MAG: hypothetical protein J0H73_14315 [Salana multivorans]|uniref:hypothetical protein n=1 Tax=Salana multivorans TaxID=120377 RepID=UPI000ADBDB32|nr:hypothetical protein [Salana multivorans]MBN8883475.1 hypothetical protein [Salana multivorans]